MNKILAVSILAITAVSSANAKIVSESLLTSTPGTYTSTNTVQAAIADAKKAGTDAAALASGKVSSVGTGSENGTISVNGSDVAVKGLKSAAYTESSAYATAAQGTLATNAVPKTTTVNGHALSSNVTVTKSDVGLGNVDNTSDANKPISTATQSALDAKGSLFSETSGGSYAAMKTGYAEMTTQYPSVATVGAWLEDVSNDIGGDVSGKQDILVSSGDGANVNYIGSGTVIKDLSATGGVVSVTKGSITNADISSSAAIAPSKIATDSSNRFVTDTEKSTWSGKQAALGGSSNKGKAVTTSASDGSVTYTGIDTTVTASSSNLVTSGAVSTAINSAKTAAIADLDVSTASGDGHVVTAVTQTDGKIAVTKTAGSITNADISSSAAISPSKIATDASNRFVTDTNKTTWNGKQNAIGGTAGQLVATTSTAGTVAYTPSVPSAIPSTPNKDGMFVLTAKVVNSTPTFYWEDIGR